MDLSYITSFQASIRAQACWFNISCSLNGLDFEQPENANKRDELIKSVTNENTAAIKSAKESMNFENIETLEQGSSTLYAITVYRLQRYRAVYC